MKLLHLGLLLGVIILILLIRNKNIEGYTDLDSEINITDIVSIIYFILHFVTPTELQQILSDYNSDGQVNITDVMLMVIYIIE